MVVLPEKEDEKEALPEHLKDPYENLSLNQKKAIPLLVYEGYSQSQVADSVGVSQPCVSKWLNDENHRGFQEIVEYKQKQIAGDNVHSIKGTANIATKVITNFVNQMSVVNPDQKDFNNALQILSRFGLVDVIKDEIKEQLMEDSDGDSNDVEVVLHQYFGSDNSREELETIYQIFEKLGRMDRMELEDSNKALAEEVLNEEKEVEAKVK